MAFCFLNRVSEFILGSDKFQNYYCLKLLLSGLHPTLQVTFGPWRNTECIRPQRDLWVDCKGGGGNRGGGLEQKLFFSPNLGAEIAPWSHKRWTSCSLIISGNDEGQVCRSFEGMWEEETRVLRPSLGIIWWETKTKQKQTQSTVLSNRTF